MIKSILIIDDDEEDHIIIRDALMDIGANVVIYSAHCGRAGLKLLEELIGRLPSLILLDFNMPKMDGLEVLKLIKEKYSIPVIIHTSDCTEQFRDEAKSKGAMDCIKKGSPAEIAETAELVKKIIKKP
jgi:CheY-like chemotaxis protein